jgi:hypothetical protein
LDDLEEEFMDGRIQFAFARVEDPNVSDWDWVSGAIGGLELRSAIIQCGWKVEKN